MRGQGRTEGRVHPRYGCQPPKWCRANRFVRVGVMAAFRTAPLAVGVCRLAQPALTGNAQCRDDRYTCPHQQTKPGDSNITEKGQQEPLIAESGSILTVIPPSKG
jgi:hypothetical protein